MRVFVALFLTVCLQSFADADDTSVSSKLSKGPNISNPGCRLHPSERPLSMSEELTNLRTSIEALEAVEIDGRKLGTQNQIEKVENATGYATQDTFERQLHILNKRLSLIKLKLQSYEGRSSDR